METICLVIPPSLFLLDERVFPSLGILKVAASLEERGWPVEVLDLSGIENYLEVLTIHAKDSKATIWGFTSTTPQMPATAKLVDTLRVERPDAAVIIGGPHPTLINAARKKEEKSRTNGRAHRAFSDLTWMFDIIVAGDGEDAIFEALDLCGKSKGLVDGDDPKSPLFLTNKRLGELPPPARHLIDLDTYKYMIEGFSATSLIAQLGCPFQCGFCGGRESPMLRRIRMRSIQSIIDEMTFLHEQYGYTGFMFYDDELNVNKKMVELMNEISNLQDRLGIEFRLRGFAKAELLTEEQAKSMYRAGFRQLLTGFESGSPQILENINKRATRDDNTRAVEIAKKYGLKVKALMSIGHPGESYETIEETKQWLLDMEPDDFDCTIITTYPGCPYYDEAVETKPGIWTYTYEKTGDRLHAIELNYNETADYYKGDPNLDGGYQAYVYTDYIFSNDLVTARDDLERYVRNKLEIPFNQSTESICFDHSMGQGSLPSSILRVSQNKRVSKMPNLLPVIE